MQFEKPVLIYIPCYNCVAKIAEVLSNIPAELHNQIECLVVDNHSSDHTMEKVLQEKDSKKYTFKINLIRTTKNIDYAGTQKLAYFLATQSPRVSHVIMLHGDGQYHSSQLTQLIPYLNNKNYTVINGYRDKTIYTQEETPHITYIVIKILNFLESFITGYSYMEWHSGFVMYSIDFLKKVPLQYLSKTRHIDGEFLICAGILQENTISVPIYKKYKEYKTFRGLPRIKYIWDILKVMFKFKRKYYHQILKSNIASKIDYDFDII